MAGSSQATFFVSIRCKHIQSISTFTSHAAEPISYIIISGYD